MRRLLSLRGFGEQFLYVSPLLHLALCQTTHVILQGPQTPTMTYEESLSYLEMMLASFEKCSEEGDHTILSETWCNTYLT